MLTLLLHMNASMLEAEDTWMRLAQEVCWKLFHNRFVTGDIYIFVKIRHEWTFYNFIFNFTYLRFYILHIRDFTFYIYITHCSSHEKTPTSSVLSRIILQKDIQGQHHESGHVTMTGHTTVT